MDTRSQEVEEPKQTIYRKQAEQIIRQMQRQGIEGFYFPDAASAVAAICSMIPPGSVVGLGGSVTITQTGLIQELRKLDIKLLDRFREGVTVKEVDEMRQESMHADLFIASSNAITLDGKLVNMDGKGNRVAAMIYGPKKVILLVGMNKVVPNVMDAITRIKTVAAPFNAARVKRHTPCAVTGVCQDPNCTPPNRICSQLVIIESNAVKDRLNVVLIGEEYGF
ncbi:lactate utilization protein [Bacteroidota bacterium]